MSTVASIHRLEPAQRTAAKVAGFLYLFLIVSGVFSEFYARGSLIVRAFYLPIMIFEIALGIWLLVKGIQAPVTE